MGYYYRSRAVLCLHKNIAYCRRHPRADGTEGLAARVGKVAVGILPCPCLYGERALLARFPLGKPRICYYAFAYRFCGFICPPVWRRINRHGFAWPYFVPESFRGGFAVRRERIWLLAAVLCLSGAECLNK